MHLTAGIQQHTMLSIDSLKSLSYHNARRLDAVQAERIGFVLRLLFYRRKIMSKYEPIMELGRKANCKEPYADLCGDPADSWLSHRPLVFDLQKRTVGLWVSSGQNFYEKADSGFSKNIGSA